MLRHLVACVVLGTLLFVGKRAVEAHNAERPQLSVVVRVEATPREVERAIDEAVLLELAVRSKSALIDPVVREQLLRAMRLQEEEQPHEREHEQALLKRALVMGVHRVDPLVRQRLIFQAQQVLRASLRVPKPTQAELQRYLEAHAARYREPARVSFRQIFISRSRHAETLDADLSALARQLNTSEPVASSAAALSDPTLLPFELEHVSTREVDSRFGPGVGEIVHALPEAQWSGPIVSSYGLHFVYVTERVAGRLPNLNELHRRVLADCTQDALERALKAALRELRNNYRIALQRAAA